MRPAHHPPSEAFTVVSLTEPGRALAERLLAHWPDAEHLYRPQPFQEAVQARFQQGFKKRFKRASNKAGA